MSMAIRSFLGTAVAAALTLGAAPLYAQTSTLYLTGGSGTSVQGGAVTGTFSSGSAGVYDVAIAVQSTIRTYGDATFRPVYGAEYTLAGAFTGTTYENIIGCCVADGTTDGTYNYALLQQPGPNNLLYRFGLDWTNPEIVDLTYSFQSLPEVYRLGRVTGITWDPRDNSFWFAQPGFIFNVSSSNEAVAGYLTPYNSIYQTLAFDTADNTLWLTNAGLGTDFVQYDPVLTFGRPTPLSSFTIDGVFQGSEFALVSSAIPEPGTWAFLILGFGMIGGGLRRERSKLALKLS